MSFPGQYRGGGGQYHGQNHGGADNQFYRGGNDDPNVNEKSMATGSRSAIVSTTNKATLDNKTQSAEAEMRRVDDPAVAMNTHLGEVGPEAISESSSEEVEVVKEPMKKGMLKRGPNPLAFQRKLPKSGKRNLIEKTVVEYGMNSGSDSDISTPPKRVATKRLSNIGTPIKMTKRLNVKTTMGNSKPATKTVYSSTFHVNHRPEKKNRLS